MDTLEELRERLNKLVAKQDAILHRGEILEISEKLDKLICEHLSKTIRAI